MLRPARLLKRITAFNNPAFAKISQRSRITFAAANQRARSHCFADHLFLPGVTFAKMEARYYGSPHCFRGKGGGETRQTKRSNLRFEFFPFYIYIYIFILPKNSWKFHRALVAGDTFAGCRGPCIIRFTRSRRKGWPKQPFASPCPFDEQSPF